ncbi:SBBP repeat-containing protein, partial [Pontibacter toksunensis]
MKIFTSLLALQLLLTLICLPAAAQEPILGWEQRYDGQGSWADEPTAMAVDEEGYSYITGTSRGVGIVKIITIKYSPTGQQVWAVKSEVDATARAVAVDNAGSVYVTGFSEDSNTGANFITFRYDATTGEQVWSQQYDGPDNNFDFPVAIVANNGSVYVTGDSFDNETKSDYATVRYDAATGEELWVMRYNGPDNLLDEVKDIAVDETGGVYVTGRSYEAYATIRYDTETGEEVWVKRYSGLGTGLNIASAIAVDDAGGVYVTGSSSGDYATIRYEATTGSETWVARYNGSDYGFDDAKDIAVDNNGGVYVTGSSAGDYATVGYHSETGQEVWVKRYNGPDGGNDEAKFIVSDNAGGVTVSGSSPGYQSGTGIDIATVHYTAETGEEKWVQRYNGPANGNDEVRAMATDMAGSIYVTGSTNSDIVTIKYLIATGQEAWMQYHDETGSLIDEPVDMAVDKSGNSYVTGTSRGVGFENITTIKYDPSGQQLWVAKFEGTSSARGIDIDEAGGIYVTGRSTSSGTSSDYITIRYDAETGTQTWATLYNGAANGTDEVSAIAVDEAGGVYVTGRSISTSSDYATVRYNTATGEETWVMRYNGATDGYDQPTAIAVDRTGGVYVTGYSDNNGNQDYATIRYDAATGQESWVQRYSGASNGFSADQATAIAVDNNGGVYVTGSSFGEGTGPDYATVRYDATTGNETWVTQYNGPANKTDEATAITTDNSGGVYVTGSSTNENTAPDFATVRYEAATGEETWAQRYNGPANGFDEARAIAVDNVGGVYVSGRSINTSHDIATIRYSTSTGEETWVELYDGADNNDEEVRAIAVNSDGSVYITGFTFSPVTGNDFLTIKYSQQTIECPATADDAIAGSSTVAAGTEGAVYYLSGPAPLFTVWSITDSEGNSLTDFTGQDSPTISVDWPSAPDFYRISLTYVTQEGCTLSTAPLYVHVYAPDAGFVTGGGRIESPAAPAYEFMQTSKRAHWSLVARYSKRNGEEDQVQGSTML